MKQFQFAYSNEEDFREDLSRLDFYCKESRIHMVLFQIYSEVIDLRIMKKICGILDEVMPEARYSGCSANGNILNGQFAVHQVMVIATVFEKPSTRIKIFQYSFSELSDKEISAQVLKEAEKNPWVKAIEMFITIPSMSTTALCDGFQGLREDIQVFGGMACSTDISSTESFVFSKGHNYDDRGIVFIFYGGDELYATAMKVTGWQPLGRIFRVTRSEGSIIYELDGQPAYDAYKKYLNIENDDHFFVNTLEFPLFYEHNGTTILRAPVASNPDGSITMSSDVDTGSVTRIAYGNPSTILQVVTEESGIIKAFQPDVLHIFSCAARRTFWNSDVEAIKELRPFRTIANSSGFFTHGEFLRFDGCLNQHNVTLVVAAFREGELDYDGYKEKKIKEYTAERVPIVTRLAAFIGAAVSELEEANHKLENMNQELEQANQRYEYMALHDGLTNLYNRAEIQRQIERGLERVKELPFCLIMLDIDNFKRINDTYGHQMGDQVIVELSNIIRDDIVEFASDTIAGRWGGEEFMVFVPGLDEEETVQVADQIRERFQTLKFPGIQSQSVSIGVTQAIPEEALDRLLVRVDEALYQAKNTGKNKVVAI